MGLSNGGSTSTRQKAALDERIPVRRVRGLDRPLSAGEQAEPRAISTRALITPTSLVTSYERGDLTADPRRLVERYFDAFLYLANWGTHRLTFQLPTEVLGPSATAVAEQYLVGDCSTAGWERSQS